MKRIFNWGNVIIIAVMMLSASCATTHQVLLGDVISFGDNAITSYGANSKGKGRQESPYVLYTPGGNQTKMENARQEKAMRDFVDNTQMENNTAGIYAMDLALERIKYVRKHQLKHDPNSKYYIIYMTDGLDNISVQVAKNNGMGNYKTPEKYKAKMQKKISKISRWKKKTQNPFDIYPVVFTGSDLGKVKQENKMTNSEFESFINRNMGWLRGSSRGPQSSPEIIQAENFDLVLEKFKDEFNASGFEFHVPKGYVGKNIKMTFKDINGRKTELTGDFIRKGNKYFLKNISMKNGLQTGIQLKKGKKLELTAINNKDKKAELAIFRLEKPRFNGKSYFIEKDLVEQSVNDGGLWVKNSEYISQSKGSIDTYFILVFDASKSLKGDGFAKERQTAMDMIKVIRGSAIASETKVDDISNDKKK